MDADLDGGSSSPWLTDYWDNLTGGLAFHVRQTPFDVLLVTLALGTVLILLILYFTYLLVRRLRVRHPYRRVSKADRPLWILSLIVAGSAWVVSVLLDSGSFTVTPEAGASCALIKHVGVYLFGYSLWICLVLYKLVRKFYQFRVVKYQPPHALAVVAGLWVPFILLAIISSVFDESSRTSEGTCTVSWQWMLPTYGLLAAYAGLFIFLMSKIRRTIGEHHQVIRYSIFLATSFLFPLADGIALAFKILDYPSLMGQLLVLLTLLLVLGNMTHIFVLVLRGRQSRRIMSSSPIEMVEDGSPHSSATAAGTRQIRVATTPEMMALSLSSHSSSSTLSSPTSGRYPHSAALDDINALLAEGSLEPPVSDPAQPQHPASRIPPPMFRRPRRSLEEEMAVDFEEFVQRLPEELAAKIDRNRGFFASPHHHHHPR